jgi:hypothetical protein
MSMSEFDELPPEGEEELPFHSLSKPGKPIPEDFSEEDIAFAQELGALFSPDQEEVPPYFVQTLLQAESECFRPPETGFEHRTRANVFRQLELRRPLFPQPRPVTPWLTRRPFALLGIACLLLMLTTMAVTSTAFAAGMAYLLSGPQSGVIQLSSYPTPTSKTLHSEQIQHSENRTIAQRKLSLLEMQQQLHFPVYWPIDLPSRYVVEKVNLYKGSERVWTDGPIIELECHYSSPGVLPHGSGKIRIWEFKPLGKGRVLQGVEIGSAHQIKVDSSGQPGIVVNGNWKSINKTTYVWVDNGSVELIYERNGIIFWIQGDQRDGLDKEGKMLANIAASLQALDANRIAQHMSRYSGMTQSMDDAAWTFAGHIYDDDFLIVSHPDKPLPPTKSKTPLPRNLGS